MRPSLGAGWGDAALVLAGFAVLALLLPVGTDPPIGDAWSYAWSARELVEHGRLRLTDFQAMSLVGQLWLAWPFARLGSTEPGFLNALSFGFSAATACGFLGLLRAAGAPRAAAALGVATLVANPIYLAQSMTFDTEIYFLFASIAGCLAFVVWLQRGGPWLLALAVGAFALAVLIRQHALVFPLAAALAIGRSDATRGRRAAPLVALALVPLALAGFYAWLRLSHGVPKAFSWQQAELVARLGDPVGFAAALGLGVFQSLPYLGIFLLPLLPSLVRAPAPPRRRIVAYAAAASAVAAGTALLWRRGEWMPYLPNLITLHEVFLPSRLHEANLLLRQGLTAVSAALGALLIGALASSPRAALAPAPASPGRAASQVFLAASALGLFAFSLATGLRFERYLLLPLPFAIAWLLARGDTGRRPRAGWIALVPLLAVSLYFVDQRVRFAACEWNAAQAAVSDTRPRFHIDGGVAFNGYFSYERMTRAYSRAGMPWHPADHPLARFLVRPLPLPEAQYELLQRTRCPNHRGLRDFEALLYRRR